MTIAQKRCKIALCTRSHRALGFCNAHYLKYKRFGDPLWVAPDRPKKICNIKSCTGKHWSKGYCQRHYTSFHNYGNPLYIEQNKKPEICTFSGCGLPHHCKGYCKQHYSQYRYNGKLTEIGAVKPARLCGYKGCGAVHFCKGFCRVHYNSEVRQPEYNSWASMIQRCTNPSTPNFKWYGAKGVAIDPRWRVFKNFLKDMGPRPSMEHTLDRIDPSGNYEPGNCRWATWDIQSKNKKILL